MKNGCSGLYQFRNLTLVCLMFLAASVFISPAPVLAA